ncbi:hypothetical protein [Nitratireductor basaltis]|uniref:Uncharacterized protein n=1 Tax=Nitratireductor basaltis TaxID=472175 RepID=A0A084UC08_9HYPH|nr:hypothetical protein [Nitratireductor basaltis]KFB10494.1 hypothetical protein EL18_01529 [Nitratireductor basaltis]
MLYSPEHHLKAARELEQRANRESDPQKKAELKELASQRRLVAKAGRRKVAQKATENVLSRAQKSASRKT